MLIRDRLPLKRELSVEEWDNLVKDVRASVETVMVRDQVELYECVVKISREAACSRLVA